MKLLSRIAFSKECQSVLLKKSQMCLFPVRLLGVGSKLLCTVILLITSGFDPNLAMALCFH